MLIYKRKNIRSGILFGNEVKNLYMIAQELGFAIPAINIADNHGINAVLEAATNKKSPIIIQISYGGSINFAGKIIVDKYGEEKAAVIGAVAAAKYITSIAQYYDIPIVLHTDHAPKSRLPWLNGVLATDEAFFTIFNRPLFSSHMIDLSREDLDYNIKISKKFFKRMYAINQMIEIEIGATGGEEDGIVGAPFNKNQDMLYSRPKDVFKAYLEMLEIGDLFTIAATFGNVHGVYHSGNVKLNTALLEEIQYYISQHSKSINKHFPLKLVFHGSSGSSIDELKESVKYGVVKVNVDTDLQWSQWKGVMDYYNQYHDRLQKQVGTPDDENLPNKKFYDPRKWLRESEISMANRIEWLIDTLGSSNILS